MNGTVNTMAFPTRRWTNEPMKPGNAAASKAKTKPPCRCARYADDWIVVIRGTKAQAQDIKEACKAFLRDEMG